MSRLIETAAVFLLTLAVTAGNAAYAQSNYKTTPVEVSKEKVKVNGVLYYSHIVLERQTLYSISKAYGVSIDDIYKSNPSLKESGLKKNSILLIPIAGNSPASAAEAAGSSAKQPSGNAGAAEDRDGDRNKTGNGGRTEGSRTEDRNADSRDGAADRTEGQTVHTVRWFETLGDIAEKYGLTQEDIIRANRLEGTKLKSRQKLVIPSGDLLAGLRKEAAMPEAAAEPAKKADEKADDGGKSPEAGELQEQYAVTASEKTVKAALLLPFKSREEKPGSSAFDFYCGALLAARDLGNSGINLSLDVCDITDENDPVTGERLKNDDFIIGPVSPADIRKVIDVAGTDKPLISPLDPKAAYLAAEFPNLIQVPTPHDLQYADLIQWMADETKDGDRSILVKEKGGKESEGMTSLENILNLSGIEYRTISYSILEGRDILDVLRAATSAADTVNRFIIASESEAFVNDIFRNINLLAREGRKVEIFCHSKVRGYDIEVENLHNDNLHISLGYYIDYNNPGVIRFVRQYRALFKTEPTQFSFQGYDITSYFSRMCAEYGENWLRAVGKRREVMLQAIFDFRDSSRINEGVRRIEYQSDYRIEPVE